MPEKIRATDGRRCAPLRRSAFRVTAAAILFVFAMPTVQAQGDEPPLLNVYLQAFAALSAGEIAAMVLTLGVLLFAVVSAIMLVRARARAALQAEGVPVAVVSMPCWELFEEQDVAYRASVLGDGEVRVAVEAAVRQILGAGGLAAAQVQSVLTDDQGQPLPSGRVAISPHLIVANALKPFVGDHSVPNRPAHFMLAVTSQPGGGAQHMPLRFDHLPGFIESKLGGLKNGLVSIPVDRIRRREFLDANTF